MELAVDQQEVLEVRVQQLQQDQRQVVLAVLAVEELNMLLVLAEPVVI